MGNPQSVNTTACTYDAAEEMLTAGGVAYRYGASGNQTSRGGDTFVWDHENRLRQSVIGGATATSTYNGDGLRMSHTVKDGVNPVVTTDYVWDVYRSLPVVLQDNTNTYVYGLDLIAAIDAAGNETYFTYDGIGSTANLTDASGNLTGSYTYDVFGATTSGPATNDWQYTGEQKDADSGLYYLRARYYDPATGRFLGRDPIMAGHAYAYVESNPANMVDPLGLCGLNLELWRCADDVIDFGGSAVDVGQCIADPRCVLQEGAGHLPVWNPCIPHMGCDPLGVQLWATCAADPIGCVTVGGLGRTG